MHPHRAHACRAASMLQAANQVKGLQGSGMLFCCPIPAEFAAEGQQVRSLHTNAFFFMCHANTSNDTYTQTNKHTHAQIESAITQALHEASTQGIAGNEVGAHAVQFKLLYVSRACCDVC